MSEAQVLLTVSGAIAPDTAARVAAGERPRADYLELARACGADLVDLVAARRATGRLGQIFERVGGPGLLLAWYCYRVRGRYGLIFSDGEQVGLPLALLLKFAGMGRPRPRHLTIGHRLTAPKKALLLDRLGLQSHIDQILVYASSQAEAIRARWGLDAERVVLTPFMVDSRFFRPDAVPARPGPRPQICTAGLEWRDYPTLMEAVRGLDVQVTIAAASPWSKRPDSTAGAAIPDNVAVRRLSQFELRQLYADSSFVVMPLYEVDFQAGVTAILEAMAMGKAVICSRTRGQTDVVIDGETGLYVPPGDAGALRAAIERLLADPGAAERMGRAGRRRVEELMSLDRYAERIGGYVRALLPAQGQYSAVGSR